MMKLLLGRREPLSLCRSTSLFFLQKMANSKYEYVRAFEDATDTYLLKNCFLVVRIDGQKFHKFSAVHRFHKPNDKRCLDLMNTAARSVMSHFAPHIAFAYGQSDEYSFFFRRKTDLFKRRMNKFTSLVPSAFTSAFVRNWTTFFPDTELQYDPAFDARCVLYPDRETLLDYLRWRQVDCHINNLYNSTFHALTGEFISHKVVDGELQVTPLSVYQNSSKSCLTAKQATDRLNGTVSGDKNEILFSEFGVNYNNELEQFKKGTIVIVTEAYVNHYLENKKKRKGKHQQQQAFKESCDETPLQDIETRILHTDVIGESFFADNRFLLEYLEEKKS